MNSLPHNRRRKLRFESCEARRLLAADVSAASPLQPAIETLQADSVGEGEPTFAANQVNLAGEGFKTLELSPTGSLDQILWVGEELLYRTRQPDGDFQSQVVTTREFDALEFYARGEQAQLLHKQDGSPIVVMLIFDGFAVFEPVDGQWQEIETVEVPSESFWGGFHLAADVGPNDSIHLAITEGYWELGRLLYGTNQSGAWEFSTASEPAALRTYFYFTGTPYRYVSMEVDSDGFAHIAFTPEFIDNGDGFWSRPYDELAYVTNRSGGWQTEIVHQPSDDSGQSGVASSLALRSDGQPAIAHFFVDRVGTGSALSSRLLFHQRDADGNWSTETITDRPDGYVAGDGDRFTGFSPHLLFDVWDRPHVAFSDHASQHFNGYADEFSGQIRHAVKDNGQWYIANVYRQTDPVRNMLFYPTMELLPNEAVYVGLQRVDQIDGDDFVTSSTYQYVEIRRPHPGVTVESNIALVQAGGTIDVTVKRHNVDTFQPAIVHLTSSQPSLVPTKTLTIPAGAVSASTTIDIGAGLTAGQNEVISLSASIDFLHPGSTVVTVQPALWHNAESPYDVNNNGEVSPIDALRVINWIARTGGSTAGTPPENLYPDVNNDGVVSPSDALRVINRLERITSAAEAEDGLQVDEAIAAMDFQKDDRLESDVDLEWSEPCHAFIF